MARPKFEQPNADNSERGKARAEAAREHLRALQHPPRFSDGSVESTEEAKPAGVLPEPEKKKRTAPPANKRKR